MTKGANKVVPLFGEPPVDPPKPPKEKAPVARLLDRYHHLFVARHGVKPRILGGRDGKILQQLITTWGEQTVEQLLEQFIDSNDRWATLKGWSIPAFDTMAQGLLLSMRDPTLACRTSSHNLAANIEMMQRVTRKR